MADIVVALDQPAARLPNVAGGKGAALAKMTAAGLPVPSGFVATVQAFKLSGFSFSPRLQDQLGTADPSDLEGLEPLCRSARQAIASAGIPEEVASAVAAAYQDLGDGISKAVRSSATAEDQPWASFAGQYDTFLNVIGYEAVLDRLLEVWTSPYSTRAVAYRLRLGIPHHSVSMAVVVQQQVQAQAAGVLFTRDPVNREEGRYLVNAALGMGEGVVSGQVPTDTFALDSQTQEVVSHTLAKKDAMFVAAAEGGITRIPVAESLREAPALSDESLSHLGRLAQRLTTLFNGHQDVEFALVDNEVQLLQSRPMTGLGETPPFTVVWDDPADAEYTWVRGQRATDQGAPPRLQEDVLRIYAEGSRVCFEETGAPMARNHIIRFFNGFSYSRSPQVDAGEVSRRVEQHQALDHAYREEGTTLYLAEIEPQVVQALAKLDQFRPRNASIPSLIQHLEHTLKAYGHVMGDLHWRMAGGIRLDWPSTLSRHNRRAGGGLGNTVTGHTK